MSEHRRKPKRIRVGGLEETQLPDVVEVDRAAVAQCQENGLGGEEMPGRTGADLISLTRWHNVRVAEADHQVAGYSAWRDESPGVAYIEEMCVHPDWQRMGVGSALMNRIDEEARETKLKFIVLRCYEKAKWAIAFYKKHGFVPISDDAPPKVQHWKEEIAASGKPFVAAGQIAMWRATTEPPVSEDEDEDEIPADDNA